MFGRGPKSKFKMKSPDIEVSGDPDIVATVFENLVENMLENQQGFTLFDTTPDIERVMGRIQERHKSRFSK